MQQLPDTQGVESGFFADDEDEVSQGDKYLLFKLGQETYGVAIEDVTEIVAMQKVAEVPDMPHFVKGVVNLRGTVIPVIDLRLRFSMAEREYDDRTCIIVLCINRTLLGVIVDTVADVHDILESDIEPPPQFKNDAGRNRFISGLGKSPDGVTILVDAERLLNGSHPDAAGPTQHSEETEEAKQPAETPAHGGQHEAGRE